MKYRFLGQRVLLSVSLSLSAILSGPLVARAEVVDSVAMLTIATPAEGVTADLQPAAIAPPTIAKQASPSRAVSLPAPVSQLPSTSADNGPNHAAAETTATEIPGSSDRPTSNQPDTVISPSDNETSVVAPTNVEPVPLPGSAATSATDLKQVQASPADPSTPGLEAPAAPDTPIAAPAGTETRYQFSYVGFGVNLGAGGDTGLGDISFAAVSKFAFSPHFSFRPSVLVSDDVSFLLPITYDFAISGPGRIAPFVGAGAKFSTGEEDNVDLLLTAGIDYPINPQLVATASVNVGPVNDFDIGFILGLAYMFSTRVVTTPVLSVSELVPPQPPRPNPSYFGLGINLGAGGDSGLGNISAALYSKIALNSYLSFRPALLITSNVSFLLPITYDFPVIRLSEYLRLAPFAGVGASFSTGDDSNVDMLLTAGVDLPITSRLTATASVNVGPFDEFDVGFILGVAYTFGTFDQ